MELCSLQQFKGIYLRTQGYEKQKEIFNSKIISPEIF